MIIRSGLHCQRMEKRRNGFLSDDGGSLTAIAAGSVENLSVLSLARRMTGMAHREFGHMGVFAHPGRFAQCLQRCGRGPSVPQPRSVPASVLELATSLARTLSFQRAPDRVQPALGERMTLAHCF
jgi:hypothetical protein